MPVAALVQLGGGVLLVYAGAEWLVRGGSRIALGLAIRPVVVGLTVVAFGTSLPEFVVSMTAALEGARDVALGNILGSNVANIGLVLGIAALLSPLAVERKLVRREVPIAIGAALLLFLLALDGTIGRIDGALLLAAMVAFLAWSIAAALRERAPTPLPVARGGSPAWNALLLIAGIMALGGGGRLLVGAAVDVARFYGISELFIGISMVAIGTSLPELATSVVAALRGEHDISVGNVVGSNIFNILFVMGAVALVRPIAVSGDVLRLEFPFLIGASLVLLPVLRTGFVISRLEGALLLAGYGAFLFFAFG